ncbi:hypothetical protein [Chengkuizengella axinellae]|uniref:DUF4825 domain-containing protein n=1 Tax=Chengkuizengella axinellae TaxID=3064388 RepID=A0ABT9J0J6_9BACL|nr:hypothetical protein [Chengkuizengella sp. 2205SS18-9]MDP5275090.1 hypothetical protein [Chengkuizengella sp. 2205SS18-9]
MNRKVMLILLFLVLNTACNEGDIDIQDVEQYIEGNNISSPVVKKLNDEMYYIFSDKRIDVYKGGSKANTSTGSLGPDGIMTGGYEKGSFGMIINNKEVLEKARYYTLTYNNEVRIYELDFEKDNTYLIVQDERIFNPINPDSILRFLDKDYNLLLNTNYKE